MIAFIRQYPNGRRALSEYGCKSPEIEHLAHKFIALEGAYVCEILSTGGVRLAACMFVNGIQNDVEVELSTNGPAMDAAVERLIRASVKHVEPQKVLPFKKRAPALKLITPDDGSAA